MALTRTVKEMHAFLGDVIKQGYGDAALMFDTDGRTFDYHLAMIGSSYCEPETFMDEKGHVSMNEISSHEMKEE